MKHELTLVMNEKRCAPGRKGFNGGPAIQARLTCECGKAFHGGQEYFVRSDRDFTESEIAAAGNRGMIGSGYYSVGCSRECLDIAPTL